MKRKQHGDKVNSGTRTTDDASLFTAGDVGRGENGVGDVQRARLIGANTHTHTHTQQGVRETATSTMDGRAGEGAGLGAW